MALPKVMGTYAEDVLTASAASIIAGFSGNDSITGSAFDDQLFGGHSPWTEYGFNENYQGPYYKLVGDNDTLNAGAGNDVIFVGTETDLIDGGSGLDQLNFWFDGVGEYYHEGPGDGQFPLPMFVQDAGAMANVRVDLAAGTYSGQFIDDHGKIVASANGTFSSIEAVFGSAANDTILGSKNNDQFKPFSGNDKVDGRGGFDVLSYNDGGANGIVADFSSMTVKDTAGDTDRFSGIEQIIGSQFDDVFKGAGGQQIFTGGNGNDTFNGGGGADIVDYHLEVGTKGLLILLKNNTGRDTYGHGDTFESIEDIRGSTRADVISGNGLANEFWGDGGKDNIDGGDRNDTLHGGDGEDTLLGGIGNDSLLGDGANDTLKGADGTDTLHGGDAEDSLDGQKGDDLLFGDDGNDTLVDNSLVADDVYFGRNGNTMNGGTGQDTIKGAGVMHGDADNDSLFGVGTLFGDDGDDRLEATEVQNQPNGIWYIHLVGGAGADTLVDAIDNRGTGIAVADYSYIHHAIQVSLGVGKIDMGGGDVDTLVKIRALQGTDFNDTIFGSFGSDVLFGGKGDDRLMGGEKADVLEGGDGRDILRGEAGRDALYGGADADTLFGEGGDDLIKGGAGNDEFHSGEGSDEMLGEAGNDTFYIEGDGASAIGDKGNDTFYFAGGRSLHYGDGGAGKDSFVVAAGSGSALIADFESGQDKVDLTAFHIKNFKALIAKAVDTGSYVSFDLGHGDALVLQHRSLSDAHKGDFIL